MFLAKGNTKEQEGFWFWIRQRDIKIIEIRFYGSVFAVEFMWLLE